MGETTSIAWTDASWNPWVGCTKVSPGCTNCYMYRDQKRYGHDPRVVRRTKPATFNAPLKWPAGKKVFLTSWSDFFHPDADAWREEAWEIIRQRPDLTFQILTKRPENIINRLPKDWGKGWENVWLGVTAENQAMANERIPVLLEIPSKVRFISCEPLLGDISLARYLVGFDNFILNQSHDPIDWVIVGGESGPKARPMDPYWVRSIRDQCQAAEIPFFFKQWGEWKAEYFYDGCPNPKVGRYIKVGVKYAGDLLDGRQWHEFPK